LLVNTPIKSSFLRWPIVLFALPSLFCASTNAQRIGIDLDAHYTAEYSRLASACLNCHWQNGGGLELQLPFTPHLAVTFDATVTQASNVKPLYSLTPAVAYDLQQTTYMGGLYYFPTRPEARLRPFVDLLIGSAYATGALSPGSVSNASAAAFALQPGVGLKIRLNHRLSITPVRADYLLTTYDNPNQSVQGALRWSTGVTFRLR
jgi:hypothetical protein